MVRRLDAASDRMHAVTRSWAAAVARSRGGRRFPASPPGRRSQRADRRRRSKGFGKGRSQ